MSTLGIVAEILREVAPRALKARQVADLAGLRLPALSKTPETAVSRDLVRTLGPPVASMYYFFAWAGERCALWLRGRAPQGSEDICQMFSLSACAMAGLDALGLGRLDEGTSISPCAEFLTCAGVSAP